MRVNVRWSDQARRLTMTLVAGSRMLEPKQRPIHIRIAGQPLTRDVVFTGRPLEVTFS
jgi:hypothetical protein